MSGRSGYRATAARNMPSPVACGLLPSQSGYPDPAASVIPALLGRPIQESILPAGPVDNPVNSYSSLSKLVGEREPRLPSPGWPGDARAEDADVADERDPRLPGDPHGLHRRAAAVPDLRAAQLGPGARPVPAQR